MVYWGSWSLEHAQDASGGTTAELLLQLDGKCKAWTDLFTSVLAAQGLTGTQKKIVPKPIPFAIETTGFYIKEVSFNEEYGADIPNYGRVYLFGAVTPADGIAGQLNDNPHSLFMDHAVVLYGGQLYDPSYGKIFADLSAWETGFLGGVTFVGPFQRSTEFFVAQPKNGRPDTKFAD